MSPYAVNWVDYDGKVHAEREVETARPQMHFFVEPRREFLGNVAGHC